MIADTSNPEERRRNAEARILMPGKVPPEVLARVLSIPRGECADVVVGPAPGEDAAVLRLTGGMHVVTSDPITFPTTRPGHYAVCVNANDVAVMGARPRYFTLTVMLPPGSSEAVLMGLVEDAVATARACGIVLIGGHTEVTEAVTRPVLSVTMMGALVRAEPLRTGGAQAGDAAVQVGCLAVEGTAILACEHAARLRREVGESVVLGAMRLLDDPGICVVEPALYLARAAGVHALHDLTEGGIITGIREMAEAADLGVRIEVGSLLRLRETEVICACLGLDPLGLISSGCLVAAVESQSAAGLADDLRRRGHKASVIGHFSECRGLTLVAENGTVREFPVFGVDELARR